MKLLGSKLFVVAVALISTTFITWPFLPNIASFYTDQGDYATHGSILWWNADSIATGRIFNQEEYFKGYQFYPHPYSLAFANNHVFPSLIFSPLYWITGSLPLSFNTYLFLTFVASFLAAFYCFKYFLGDRGDMGDQGNKGKLVVGAAAIIGAFIFSFNPQTMTRFPQHIELLGKFFLPLIFLFGYKFLEKPSFKSGFWLFLFISLNSLTANYFQVFTGLMLPLVAIPFLIKALRGGDWGYLGRLGRAGLVGLIFLPILLYFNMPFWQFSQKEGAFRSIEESIFFSGRINDWFAPPQNNLVYGPWSAYLHQFREPKDNRGILNYEEHTLFIGVLATVLFFVGLKQFSGSRVPPKARLASGGKHGMTGVGRWYFLILLIVPFILIWGPFLYLFSLFYETIPIMKGIRAPTRFEYVLFIPFALIASFGALKVLEKAGKIWGPPAGGWVVGVIGVILILENFTIKDFSSRSGVLTKLDSQTVKELSFLKGKTSLHLPIYTIDDADEFGKNSYATTWVTKTGERVVNGNSGYFPIDSLKLLFGIREDVNEEVLKRLSILGVNYVIFHTDILSPQEAAGLTKNLSLYEKGIIIKNEQLIVVDLSRYQFSLPQCNFPDDFSVKATEVSDEEFNLSHALIIKNQKECFLVNIYHDRYKELEAETEQGKKTFKFRLPMLIEPKEQIVVSEYNNELRIDN